MQYPFYKRFSKKASEHGLSIIFITWTAGPSEMLFNSVDTFNLRLKKNFNSFNFVFKDCWKSQHRLELSMFHPWHILLQAAWISTTLMLSFHSTLAQCRVFFLSSGFLNFKYLLLKRYFYSKLSQILAARHLAPLIIQDGNAKFLSLVSTLVLKYFFQ